MIKKLIWQIFNSIHKYIIAPRMIMGYTDPNGTYQPNTRISSTSIIINHTGLSVGDNVFIGHYNFIEASHQIIIGEGCQITNFVSLITHSSHNSIRLYGKHYIGQTKHIGYKTGSITIGKYSFIGPHVTILPGAIIGNGSIVAAYSLVKGCFPDFAILAGNPAAIVGDTRKIDAAYLLKHPDLQEYYDEWINNGKD